MKQKNTCRALCFEYKHWNDLSITYYKELKNGIEISVGQAVFKLSIKTVQMLIGSITQELLDLPNF